MSKLYFIQMVGIPGSGKTEKAHKLAAEYDAIVLSSDEIRKEITGNPSDQSENKKVFEEMTKRTICSLKNGKSVVYDATNISHKHRRVLLEQLKSKFDIKAIAYVMATPIQMCIDRQEQRDRKIDKSVILKMVHNFYVPYWYEGWDDIRICYPDDNTKYMNVLYRKDLERLFDKTSLLYEFDQKNPHHELTLGEHMHKCYELMCQKMFVKSIREAAMLHDIGKFYTQSFTDGIAHYYSHHNVSGYISLFNRNGDTNHRLTRAAYIQWHMAPFFWKEEKTHIKYKRLLGEQFYDDLMILHDCDIAAH